MGRFMSKSDERDLDWVASKKKRNKRNGRPVLLVVLIAAAVAVIGGIYYYIEQRTPSRQHVSAAEYFGNPGDGEVPVTAGDEVSETFARERDGQVYVDYGTVSGLVDPSFYYEQDSKLLIVTTPTEKTTLDLTGGSSEGDEAVVLDGTLYISEAYLEKWSDIEVFSYDDPKRIFIKTSWSYPAASFSEAAPIRGNASIKAPIVKDMQAGDTVRTLDVDSAGNAADGKADGFTKVETDDGFIGYVEDRYLTDHTVKNEDHESPIGDYTSRGFEGRINMVFHQTTSQDSNNALASSLTGVTGVNVIAPTWYFLDNDEGAVRDLSSSAYVDTAHNAGMLVWAVVNDFDGGISSSSDTAAAISTYQYRTAIINSVMTSVKAAGADGVNLDFEHVTRDSAGAFLELVREFSVACRNEGLYLSIDDYVPTYTSFMGRAEQARVADYVVTMCYDEHNADSDEAGSVASISFVKNGIADTLKEVPAEKLIAALPFFTRLWSTEGSGRPDSTAYGMTDAEKTVSGMNMEESWDDSAGQNYAETTVGDVKYQIWLEDEDSLRLKLAAVRDAGCAGVAEWKLGLEKEDIWGIISEYLA